MIEARFPTSPEEKDGKSCIGCGGAKAAPIATIFSIGRPSDIGDSAVTFAICEECGRDAANAIGFACIRGGGWSKLEPRNRKAASSIRTHTEVVVKSRKRKASQ